MQQASKRNASKRCFPEEVASIGCCCRIGDFGFDFIPFNSFTGFLNLQLFVDYGFHIYFLQLNESKKEEACFI